MHALLKLAFKSNGPKMSASINNNTLEDNYVISKNETGKVHPVVGIIFVILLVGLLGVVYVVDQRLPAALSIQNEEDHPNSFITERANYSLKALTDLGARITGGHTNEVLAVNLLKAEIEKIVRSANLDKIIELDVQNATGAFKWFGIGNSFINAYANIQNVVVKLHGKNSTYSVLVNAHFDSKPIGSGASDDGINCANMLEILRKFSRFENTFEHDVIFLFNGAEEQSLQASHAFITQHKWAKSVKVFVNLEGAGTGGKLAIIRIGPNRPWLMRHYKKVPYPSGLIIIEELFETGIVPSDSDFSVFSKIANLVGFDLAYYKDGYRYHTSYDNFESIPDGSYQHGGANAMVLISNLANAHELGLNPDELSSDNIIYYDYIGLFMISYNHTTGIILNVLTAIVALGISAKSIYDLGISISKASLKYLMGTMCVIFFGWILAGAFVVIVASLLDLSKQSLSWFGNTWLLLGLYSVPVFISTCGSIIVLRSVVRTTDLSLCATTQVHAHMVTSIWAIVLLLGTILKIRSFCFVQLLVLFQTIAFTIILVLRLQKSNGIYVCTFYNIFVRYTETDACK